MNTNQSPSQQILTGLFSQLREHSDLVHRGIDSQQAANIVFSRPIRVTNENDVQQVKEHTHLSDCCQADVYFNNSGSMLCKRCHCYCGFYLG